MVFVDYFQSIVGATAHTKGGAYWEVNRASYWQAGAGITPKQWEAVKADLGDSGLQLLSFSIHVFGNAKGTWIRPSDKFLAVFGMSLKNYDAVMHLNKKMSLLLSPWRGPAGAAVEPATDEELSALAVWIARGGLERMANAAQLEELLAMSAATPSAQS